MARWSRVGAACLAFGLALWPALARAQRIVLLRPKTADPALLQAFGRLKGELTSHDFEVVVVDADDDVASPRELAQAAEQVGAVATVSLLRSAGLASADVWISDRVTGKTSMRTIATTQQSEGSSVLAIRAVDLLRASFREFDPDQKPPPDIVGATPDRAPAHVRIWAETPRKTPRWSIQAGVAAQSTLSRLGTLYGPAVALGVRVTPRFSTRLAFQGPLAGEHATLGGASLTLRQEQLSGELAYRLFSDAPLSVEAAGALGAHHLDVQGGAAGAYLGRSDSAWTALASAGLGVELAFTSNAALTLSGRAVLLLPRPVVEVAGERYPYGRPSLQGIAGLAVSF